MTQTDPVTAAVKAAESLTFDRDRPHFGCETASETLVSKLATAGIAARAVAFEGPVVQAGTDLHVAVHVLEADVIIDVTYG